MSRKLFAAIAKPDLDGVARALTAGADPNGPSDEWPFWSPLDEAINTIDEGGPAEVMALLLRAGARLDTWMPASGREPPFFVAVMSGKGEAIRMLLSHGADANIRSTEGLSALGWCAETGDTETAATLLRCGASATMNQAGGLRAMTPLGQAAWRLDLAMMRLLVGAGADPEARDLDGMTARERLPMREPSNEAAWAEAEGLLVRRP